MLKLAMACYGCTGRGYKHLYPEQLSHLPYKFSACSKNFCESAYTIFVASQSLARSPEWTLAL